MPAKCALAGDFKDVVHTLFQPIRIHRQLKECMPSLPNLDHITRIDLIVALNRALLGEIRPNMRRVSVDFIKEQNTGHLLFYYDSPLSQDEIDEDVPGIVLTEISCDFPTEIHWKDHTIIIPYPQKIPERGIVVYQRYEPDPQTLQ